MRCPFCNSALRVSYTDGQADGADADFCDRCGRITTPLTGEAPRALRPCHPCIYCKGKTSVAAKADGQEYDICRVCGRSVLHFPQHDLDLGRTPSLPFPAAHRTVPCWGGPMDGAHQPWDRPIVPVYQHQDRHEALLEATPLAGYVIVGAYQYIASRECYEWREGPRNAR